MYERKLNLLTFLLENDDIFVIIVLSLCFPLMSGMANEKLNGLENTIELL